VPAWCSAWAKAHVQETAACRRPAALLVELVGVEMGLQRPELPQAFRLAWEIGRRFELADVDRLVGNKPGGKHLSRYSTRCSATSDVKGAPIDSAPQLRPGGKEPMPSLGAFTSQPGKLAQAYALDPRGLPAMARWRKRYSAFAIRGGRAAAAPPGAGRRLTGLYDWLLQMQTRLRRHSRSRAHAIRAAY